jgi:hypothetical protein
VYPVNGAALVTVAALALRALVERRNLSRALLSLAIVALAAYQIRHVVLAVAIGAVLLHAEIDELFAAEGTPPGTLPGWVPAAIVLPALLVGSLAWWSARLVRSEAEWIAAATGGAPLVRLSSALPNGTHAYFPFESSGLAIWLGAERGVRVFYDSRNDCYPPDVAEAGFLLERNDDPEAVDRVLTRYGTEFVVVPDTHPVYAALERSNAWTASRSDGPWKVFIRARSRP